VPVVRLHRAGHLYTLIFSCDQAFIATSQALQSDYFYLLSVILLF